MLPRLRDLRVGLVRAASRPEDVVKGLESGPSVARWQRANELADMLRDDRYAEFKRNRESAQVLARTLDREIEAAGMSENEVAFRMYLAEALGKFEVQSGSRQTSLGDFGSTWTQEPRNLPFRRALPRVTACTSRISLDAGSAETLDFASTWVYASAPSLVSSASDRRFS